MLPLVSFDLRIGLFPSTAPLRLFFKFVIYGGGIWCSLACIDNIWATVDFIHAWFRCVRLGNFACSSIECDCWSVSGRHWSGFALRLRQMRINVYRHLFYVSFWVSQLADMSIAWLLVWTSNSSLILVKISTCCRVLVLINTCLIIFHEKHDE